MSSSLPPKRKRDHKHRRERRAREREERSEAFIHDAHWASQRPGDPSSSSIPAQVTQSGPQDIDPISAMRPAVYQPPESVGSSSTNDNSTFQIGLGSCEFPGLLPGLYKPADPDPQHDTWAFSPVAYSSEKGPPSPTRTPAAHSSDSRTRTGIVYPLQPRSRRPDVCIQVNITSFATRFCSLLSLSLSLSSDDITCVDGYPTHMISQLCSSLLLVALPFSLSPLMTLYVLTVIQRI